MSANNNPVVPNQGNSGIYNVVFTTGANNYDGTDASAKLIYQAGANGSYFIGVYALAIGTNVQSVLRVFLNNGTGANTTAANNQFLGEVTLPATTGSATNINPPMAILFNRLLAPSERIYVLLATTVSAGWAVNGKGGDL